MKKIFGLAAVLTIAAAGLWAQAAGHQADADEILTSPQYRATQGSFHSAADDFIRPDTYVNTGMDRHFTYISYDTWDMASFGYATQLGSVYLAAYYGGNFWSGVTSFNATERYMSGWPGGGKDVPVYDRLPELNYSTNTSRFAALIGFANMGIRLQYGTTWQSFNSAKDFAVIGGKYYKSAETSIGVISPQIDWSMTKPFLPGGIQPAASLALNIARDNLRFEEISSASGEQVSRSANYINPVLYLALGGYTFYNKNNFKWSADFDYQLDLYLYANDYSYLDSGSYKIKRVKGLNTGTAISEDSFISNRIRPMLSGSWSGGPLALKARLNLPMTFIGAEKTPLRINADGSLDRHGTYTKDTLFTFTPSVELGVQWKIFSDKLFINAGGKVETTLTLGNQLTTNYDAGAQEPNSNTRTAKNSFGNSSTALTAGLTFNPTANISLDASCGIEGDNSIDVFKDGGLFNFTRILVSVKF